MAFSHDGPGSSQSSAICAAQEYHTRLETWLVMEVCGAALCPLVGTTPLAQQR
jgi:hypothetical protein